jgi:hypothetical protein
MSVARTLAKNSNRKERKEREGFGMCYILHTFATFAVVLNRRSSGSFAVEIAIGVMHVA